MNSPLQESLEFQRYFGIDLTFDFITGRDWNERKVPTTTNITNAQNTKNTSKQTSDTNISSLINNRIAHSENIGTSNKENIETIENEEKPNFMPSTINLDAIKTFEELCNAINNFNGCDLKKSGAKNTVIYDGNPEAKIMLIGEAPGETEDIRGIPFCGESGQLLRKAIKFINLDENNVLITNCVFWRPPNNRTPYDEEIKLCLPFVKKMIEIVRPKIIILCGSTAMKAILTTKEKITDLAGKIQECVICDFNIKTFVLYHPSYLLRSPAKKKDFWQHLLILEDEIEKITN